MKRGQKRPHAAAPRAVSLRKRRLVKIGLLLFAVWPLLHRGLAARYEVNPWKFAGWAMYAAPTFIVDVIPMRIEAGKGRRLAERQLAPPVRHSLREYRRARTAYGALAGPPDDVGKALAVAHPEITPALIVVQTRWLNRQTAMIETRAEQFLYRNGQRLDRDG